MAKIELNGDTANLIAILYCNLSAEATQRLKESLDPEYQEAIKKALEISNRCD